MKVEVIYESIPYTVNLGFVNFHRNQRELRKINLEVNKYSEIFEALNQEGFSNHIISSRVLKEDETYDEAATRNEISKIIKKYIDTKELKPIIDDIKNNTNYIDTSKLNIVIKNL